MKPNRWRWLRLYYFDDNKDRLLLNVIAPAMSLAKQRLPGFHFYFQRDWYRGPNVLIGLKGSSVDNSVLDSILSGLKEGLASHPSRTTISASQYTALASRLSRWEARHTHSDLPCRPNNSVFQDEDEPEHTFLADPGLKEIHRNVLSSTATPALRLLELSHAGQFDLELVAMELMVTLVWFADPTALRPYTSFVSHANGFLGAADGDGSRRQLFQALYEGPRGSRVRRLVEDTVWRLESCSADTFAGETTIRNSLTGTLIRVFRGLENQSLRPVDANAYFTMRSVEEAPAGMIETMNGCNEWRAWQITISLLYSVLNQFGISPMKRFLACYLLGRAIEDVYEHDHDSILTTIRKEPRNVFQFTDKLRKAPVL